MKLSPLYLVRKATIGLSVENKKLILSIILMAILPCIFLWRVTFKGDILLAGDILYTYEPWRSEIPGAEAVPIWNAKGGDPLRSMYSTALYVKETWRNGQIPFWYPYAGLGFPLFSQAAWQALYPINNILWQFMEVTESFGWSAILHLFLVSLFTFLYARELKVGYFGSLVAAIAFTYSSDLAVWLGLRVLFDSIVWVPLIFLGLERSINRRDWRWVLLGVLGILLQFLAGSLQMAMYTFTSVGLYATARFIVLWWQKRKLKDTIYPVVYAALMMGLGSGLVAFQILPAAELISTINRTGIELDTYVPLQNLFRIVIPDLAGTILDGNQFSMLEFETHLYLGILPLFFIVASLFSRQAIVARILFGLGLLFLLVIYNVPPFYQLFYYFYPTFRSLGLLQILFAILFMWAVAAGIGADWILSHRAEKLLKGLVWGGCVVGIIVLLVTVRFAFIAKYQARYFWEIPDLPDVQPNPLYHLSTLILFLIFLGVILLFLWQWSKQRLSPPVFIAITLILLILDLFWHHIDINAAFPKKVFEVSPPSLTFMQDLAEKEHEPFRILGVGTLLRSNISGVYHLPVIQIRDSFMSQRFVDYSNLTGLSSDSSKTQIGFLPATNTLLDALNVKYIYASRQELVVGDWFSMLNMGEPYVISEHPEAGQVKYWNINNWTQPVLFAPTNSTLSYQGVLPYPAVLETAIALDPQAASQEPIIFEVYASRPGQERGLPLFSYRLDPLEKDAELKWRPVVVSLMGFANQPVILSLVTVSEDGLVIPGGWTDPLLTDGSKYEQIYYGVNSIYKNKNYLPRAWVVHNITQVSMIDEVEDKLAMAEFDPMTEAVIEGQLAEPVEWSDTLEKAQFVEYNPSHSVIEVEMLASGFLVFSDLYYPGWNVYVDGVQQSLYATNLVMRGVYVPAGTHTVEFVYEPISLKIGLAISVGTVLLLAVLLVLDWKLKRQHARINNLCS